MMLVSDTVASGHRSRYYGSVAVAVMLVAIAGCASKATTMGVEEREPSPEEQAVDAIPAIATLGNRKKCYSGAIEKLDDVARQARQGHGKRATSGYSTGDGAFQIPVWRFDAGSGDSGGGGDGGGGGGADAGASKPCPK